MGSSEPKRDGRSRRKVNRARRVVPNCAPSACVTNWVTKLWQVWPFVVFRGLARLAISLNIIGDQLRRVFYESAALPTELRRRLVGRFQFTKSPPKQTTGRVRLSSQEKSASRRQLILCRAGSDQSVVFLLRLGGQQNP
jgi:hypothetical protein